MDKLGVSPDVVLIDGCFRVACFLACWANIQRPTTVIFDDYTERRW
jgi:protein O-GlcNAc transferase